MPTFANAILLFLALGSLDALAVPTTVFVDPTNALSKRAQVSTLAQMTSSQLDGLAPYTQFARAAYCDVDGWQCGQACDAIPDFQLSLTGGDGNAVQYYYVGYWPSQNAVVVAHQGTDPTQLVSDLTDVNIFQENLDPTLFPGVDSSVMVHSGFADEHAQTASIILEEVQNLLSTTDAQTVILVGHSLGGALAELDCLFLALSLPSNIAIQGVTYGTPRVGNAAWASLFDATINNFMRVNNEKDIVPIVPGRFMGFSQVAGEVHIVSPNDAVECPGNDDATDAQCTIKTVPNIFEGNILNHLGPYQGIYIGTIYCT